MEQADLRPLRERCQETGKSTLFLLQDGNFQPVRDMHGNFAKYLGKDKADLIADEPIPGRWWGKCNRKALPFADCSELVVTAPVAVLMHRCARRITWERMQEPITARDAMIWMADGKCAPLVSRFGLLHARSNCKLRDLDAGETYSPSELAQFLALKARHLARHYQTPEDEPEPLRIGKVSLPSRMNHAKRSVLGKQAPTAVLSILRYAAERYHALLENEPF